MLNDVDRVSEIGSVGISLGFGRWDLGFPTVSGLGASDLELKL
jgi:hypothetical protein